MPSSAVDYLVKQSVGKHPHLVEHKRKKQDKREKDAENFRDKSQRHFLNLGQSLKNTDYQTDEQRNQQYRADDFLSA